MGDAVITAADLPAGCTTAIAKTTPTDPNDTRAQVADLKRMKDPADPAYGCAPARFIRAVRAVAPPQSSMGLRSAIGETDFEMQQILGYAPIEPDGSFKLAVPADMSTVNPAVQRAYDDARGALRAGRTEEAERALRAIAQANPDLGGPYANLGLIHRQAGKLPEAVSDFEKAVAANPKQPVYLNQLGVSYRQRARSPRRATPTNARSRSMRTTRCCAQSRHPQ